MNAPYFIRQKAIEDLDSIWQYTYFQWSQKQADKYYNLLIDKILFLAANVDAGRKIDHIIAGYRSYSVESHIIFYTIAANSMITVIRILHQRMDIPSRLSE
jgi:toxin ParE1/3/4